jgi:hypothetical protein
MVIHILLQVINIILEKKIVKCVFLQIKSFVHDQIRTLDL